MLGLGLAEHSPPPTTTASARQPKGFLILIIQDLYSDYLAYDERPHLHVGCPASEPVSVPHPVGYIHI